jgi:putative heme-binding domain-containing protein
MYRYKFLLRFLPLYGCLFLTLAHADVKPIRALLVTGGCCHDYARQKTILTEGISARANVIWSIIHEGDGTTDHKLTVYNDPDWSKNFDVVVHDECFADVKDVEFVRGILKPHRQGLPAVNLHCAMHCYRVDFDHFKEWFEFTGLDTRSHGAQLPIAVTLSKTEHPILKGLTNWTTVPEELYNNLEIWKSVTPLIAGQQGAESNMVAWINDYRGTRVFSTTLGHNNATVADPRYLDLITRGLLWSVNKLNADYLKPAEARKKAAKTVRVPINLALKKRTSASATQEGHAPEDAVDDDPETRWCAPDNKSGYWWQVDLGKPEEIIGARISWEHDGPPYQYRIDGSSDGKTWSTLVEQKGGPRPQVDEQKFSAQGTRYVKITVTTAPDGHWASFYEFEVLGKEMVEKRASNSSDTRLAGVQSPAGFQQSYFAGPPDISYPTCLEATPSGDVFVGVDLNGSLDRERNRGWVVRCRDTNNDGVADNFVTFAKMDSPRGLVFDNNTLYVMHPPLLEAFHDDNSDGVADRSEVLVHGLGKDLDFRGADHTCNGVRLGIDGWLYVALGDYGAQRAVAKDGSRIQVYGGGIVRVRPDGSRLEVVVEGTRNLYDLAIDPFMNLFTCDNTNDGDEWNLRLSHIIPTAHYGYPSLFKHFANESMPAMRDFGGGSPTGAIFLDEPGFPEPFGHGFYTCQWGWNTVTRHPLKQTGATFTAEKETFIRVPRPTGVAADGNGHVYIASWKGGDFNFGSPNVGFIVRVAPLNHEAASLPNLRRTSEKQLVELLGSSSAIRRLHGQQEILRRKPSASLVNRVEALAQSSGKAEARVAAIFTLGQMNDSSAMPRLVKLAASAALKEFALRALADSSQAAELPTKFLAASLDDPNPRVRLQAIVALNRLHRTEAAEAIFPSMTDNDPALAHTAFRALVSFRAADVCFKTLRQDSSSNSVAALRVLGNIHEPSVVDGLIHYLSNPAMRTAVLETLCRLYHREGDWDGSWWGTRPDTSGPYYKPVSWEATERIASLLQQELAKSDPETMRLLLVQFQKYKIQSPAIPMSALQDLAADPTLQPDVRKKAFQTVTQSSEEAALHVLLACDAKEKFSRDLRDEFVRDPKRSRSTESFAQLARNGSGRAAELAYAILLHVVRDTNAPPSSRSLAQKTIDAGKNSPALQDARSVYFPNETASVPTTVPSADTIARLSFDEVLKRATAATGNTHIGAQLFESAGCVKCHSISKNETPKGPFLGDITARYSKAELITSIVKPNATIAQGFETTTIETKEGDSLDGFVVRESGDELELRNIVGAMVIAKKNIANRGTRPTSIMPEGLVDHLPPEDLASLLRYLESVRSQQ